MTIKDNTTEELYRQKCMGSVVHELLFFLLRRIKENDRTAMLSQLKCVIISIRRNNIVFTGNFNGSKFDGKTHKHVVNNKPISQKDLK